jgi:hypothetical protein
MLLAIYRIAPERQRLATALGVSTVTLKRWADGEARPHRSHLVQLVSAIHSNQRQEFIEAVRQEFPMITEWTSSDTPEEIPSAFFAEILHERASTTESSRFWRICDFVLAKALEQLDSSKLGMAIRLVQCMPPMPEFNEVRSLRERTGKGNTPWNEDLEKDVVFLGMESLCGRAVEEQHIQYEPDLEAVTPTIFVRDDYEMSAAAHPVSLEGRIAGCLLAQSTQKHFFSRQRLDLLADFSHLIALALPANEFYERKQIALRLMPPPRRQREPDLLPGFRQRMMKKIQANRNDAYQASIDIELETWRELEKELFHIARTEPIEPGDWPAHKNDTIV